MSQTTVSIRMDKDLKKQFEGFCKDVGMSMTTAFCLYATKVVKENKIPFEISGTDPFYSKENTERLKKAKAEMEATGGTVHEVNLDD